MGKYSSYFIIVFFFSLNASAQSQFKDYIYSLYNQIGIQPSHLEAVAQSTRLSLPGFLQKNGIIYANASATYNPVTNVLTIPNDFVVFEGSNFRLKTLQEVRDDKKSYTGYAGIVFHEYSHSEFEKYVKKQITPADSAAYNALVNNAAQIVEKLAPSFGYKKKQMLLSEIFAYYREEALSLMLNDAEEIMAANGVYFVSHSCSKHPSKTSDQGIFVDHSQQTEISYQFKVRPRFVFVNGKSVDFLPAFKEMAPVYHALWNQFAFYYKPPQSRKELLTFINSNSYYRGLLEKCRNQ